MTAEELKKQQEQQQLDALRMRVQDIFNGACGGIYHEDECGSPTPEQLQRIIPALKASFESPGGGFKEGCAPQWMFSITHIGLWDGVDASVKHLWEAGVRT